MKKKIIFGFLSVFTMVFTLTAAHAGTEANLGNCIAPFTNTCMIIHTHIPFVGDIKTMGVLTINL